MSPLQSKSKQSTKPFPGGKEVIHRFRFFLLAGLMLPVIIYLATVVIQTPAEQVAATVAQMAELVELEDAPGLATFIADEYEGELEGNKAALMASARDYFREVRGTRISIKRTFVHLEGDAAEVMLVYHFRATIESSDIYRDAPVVTLLEENPNVPEKSYLRLVKQGEDWRLVFIALRGRDFADRFPAAREYFE